MVHCKRLILVNPTYQGITADNVSCVQLAKAHDITIIVDEAHGSHLHFHQALPLSLLDAGADLVVQRIAACNPAVVPLTK